MRKTTRRIALGLVLAAAALAGLAPNRGARASVCCSDCWPVYLDCLEYCAGQPTTCLGWCRTSYQQCQATCDLGC